MYVKDATMWLEFPGWGQFAYWRYRDKLFLPLLFIIYCPIPVSDVISMWLSYEAFVGCIDWTFQILRMLSDRIGAFKREFHALLSPSYFTFPQIRLRSSLFMTSCVLQLQTSLTAAMLELDTWMTWVCVLIMVIHAWFQIKPYYSL